MFFTKSFKHNVQYPTSVGSLLQVTRRRKNQEFLDLFYSELTAPLKAHYAVHYRKDPVAHLKVQIYWSIHCLQPIASIVAMMKKLYEIAGPDTYQKDTYKHDDNYKIGMLPIHTAAEAGYLDFIDYLIDEDPSMVHAFSTEYYCESTPLSCAIKANEIETAIHLINRGADVALANDGKRTPFIVAAEHGRLELMKIMIEEDPNLLELSVHGRFGYAMTTLDCAIGRGQDDIALWLLDQGADITHWNHYSGGHWQPIHIACELGRLPVVKKMVKISPQCIHQITINKSCLSLAVKSGNQELVQFLQDQGVEINMSDVMY